MDSGSENVRYGRISPGHVSYRPTTRQTLNRPPTIEIAGNIDTASEPARISVLPGKSRRVIAYAAIDASASASTVVISAMPIELISAWLKPKPFWKTAL